MPEKLLLHACCAPCLSQSYRVLSGQDEWRRALLEEPHFDIAVFFYNPNIHPEEEYIRREQEVRRLAGMWGRVPVWTGKYDSPAWFDLTWGLENEPERGERCSRCYEMRLRRAFQEAEKQGRDAVATTLTLSPHKDAEKINRIGRELESQFHIRYVFSDFKKNNGYRKSIELSRQYGLYRQNYCGCVYSRKEAEKRLIPAGKE